MNSVEACQNTIAAHSLIKLHVNIQVDWSGGQLNIILSSFKLGEIRKGPIDLNSRRAEGVITQVDYFWFW